jgi:hypothetical protein
MYGNLPVSHQAQLACLICKVRPIPITSIIWLLLAAVAVDTTQVVVVVREDC